MKKEEFIEKLKFKIKFNKNLSQSFQRDLVSLKYHSDEWNVTFRLYRSHKGVYKELQEILKHYESISDEEKTTSKLKPCSYSLFKKLDQHLIVTKEFSYSEYHSILKSIVINEESKECSSKLFHKLDNQLNVSDKFNMSEQKLISNAISIKDEYGNLHKAEAPLSKQLHKKLNDFVFKSKKFKLSEYNEIMDTLLVDEEK